MDLIPRLEEIKEDVKEIDQADILEAASIPKERAKLRKAELLAQAAAAAREPPLTTVEGTGVTCDGGQASSWKVLGTSGAFLHVRTYQLTGCVFRFWCLAD